MAVPLPDAFRSHPTKPRASEPCLDRFGACVSVAVLIAAVTAILVVRQNLDDHLFGLAGDPHSSETVGAAIGSR